MMLSQDVGRDGTVLPMTWMSWRGPDPATAQRVASYERSINPTSRVAALTESLQ
jgi:hypothetical protein